MSFLELVDLVINGLWIFVVVFIYDGVLKSYKMIKNSE